MQELISIIIPVYNVESYLDECIQSIVQQTYKNLEIILVDDGSTDSSGVLSDKWADKDSRIRVLHKENGGVSSARNEGMMLCSGNYIGFVDSDDWLEPNMFEELRKAIQNADLSICGFNEYPMGDLSLSVHIGYRKEGICSVDEAVQHIYERDGYFTSVWNKLFRRSVIFPNGVLYKMNPAYAFGEDELWLAGILRNCHQVSFVPEPLYHWRPRADSASRPTAITEKQLSVIRAKIGTVNLLPQTLSIQSLVKARLFNDCFSLEVLAYYTGEKEKFEQIRLGIAPYKREWLKSREISTLRKCKVLIIETIMGMRLSVSIVQRIDSIRRFGIKG